MVVMAVAMTSACTGDKSFGPSTDLHRLLQSVQLSTHAYNLSTEAPYDTVTLHVAATLGDSSQAPVTLHYTISDTLITVNPDGFVRGIHPTSTPVSIVVSATYNGATRADTAYVSVIGGPPTRVAAVVIRPLENDSAAVGFEYPDVDYANAYHKSFIQEADDASGTPIDGIVLDVWASDPAIVSINASGSLRGLKAGTTWLHVSTFAYGEYVTDSLQFTVYPPRLYFIFSTEKFTLVDGKVTKVTEFTNGQITVPRGSDVVWRSPIPPCATSNDGCTGTETGPAVAVIFDDSSAAEVSRFPVYPPNPFPCFFVNTVYCQSDHGGSGNMVVQVDLGAGRNGAEARQFNRPGRYPYHNTQGGTGEIIVE